MRKKTSISHTSVIKACAEAEKAQQAAAAAAAAAVAKHEAEATAEVKRQADGAALAAAIEANPDAFMYCRKCSSFFPGTICDAGHSAFSKDGRAHVLCKH